MKGQLKRLSILRRDFFNTLQDEFRSLAELDIPILIIWGRKDAAILLRSGQEINRLLEDSRFVILEDAGHLPNFEQAEKFNRLVIEFLERSS